MRISLLLKREPFGEILKESLEGFLPKLTGKRHQVDWVDRPAALVSRGIKQGQESEGASPQQVWVCNPYLNAIFLPSANETVLDPVIKEFRSSPMRWRRPLQSAYVSMATSTTLSSLMGSRALVINPEIPYGRTTLIVGGNHKIRLIDHAKGTAHGIRKHGFTDRFIRREVEARKAASKFNVRVPALLDVAEDFSWFKESYLSATPINRLPESQADDSLREAIRQLRPFYEGTRSMSTVGVYAIELCEQIKRLKKEDGTSDYIDVIKSLETFIARYANLPVAKSASHGDFQPGNILRNDSGTWLIDWEYSRERQLGYDLLVYAARSRTTVGLAQRLGELFDSSNNGQWILKTIHNPLWLNLEGRRVSIALFFLEEFLLRFEERSSSTRLIPDAALGTLCAEAKVWLRNQVTGSVSKTTPAVAVLNQMAGPMGWDAAEELGKQGGPVPLLTGHPDILKRGSNQYVTLHRAVTYDRRSFPRRIISWLRYLVQAFLWTLKLPKETSLLLYSNPPMLPWLGYLMHLLRGQRYAVMVWDIYPDVLVRKKVLSGRNPVTRLWYGLNRRAYEKADVVMTLGEYLAANLGKQFDATRTRAGKVEVIYPWVDIEKIKPIPKEENWFAKKYDQVDKLTVMYSGNMGYGHDIETMLAAAEQLQDQPQIHFMFIGDGPKWKLVEKTISEKKLTNVTLLPWQPEEVLSFSLATADVGLVSIEDDVAGLMLPSKAFSLLAAGRPLIVTCGQQNEISRITERFECGMTIPPQSVDQLCSTLSSLISTPTMLNRLKAESETTAKRIGATAVNVGSIINATQNGFRPHAQTL
jgi:glycosyltransferase involved in cell wall biosynthesis